MRQIFSFSQFIYYLQGKHKYLPANSTWKIGKRTESTKTTEKRPTVQKSIFINSFLLMLHLIFIYRKKMDINRRKYTTHSIFHRRLNINTWFCSNIKLSLLAENEVNKVPKVVQKSHCATLNISSKLVIFILSNLFLIRDVQHWRQSRKLPYFTSSALIVNKLKNSVAQRTRLVFFPVYYWSIQNK